MVNIWKLTCIELHIENTYYYNYHWQEQKVKDNVGIIQITERS